jgi:LytS/YehU family sensor histidine kinase
MLDDPEYASELLGDFTIHLRSCIRAMSNDDPLPFSQELDNIRAYVNIEKMRFGKKLNVEYDLQADEFGILPLSIQPIVENAIRHGIYERGLTGGTVTIHSGETEDNWVITVEDDGVGFDVDAYMKEMAEGSRDSTGLKNIIFRLEKVMGGHVDITSTRVSERRLRCCFRRRRENENNYS